MKDSKLIGWVAGTVVVVLAIVAGTWFLLAAPRFEAAQSTLLEAENTRGQNDLLQLKNAQLRADFEKLDEYRAEVATLQRQIPAQPELPAYVRSVDAAASLAAVFVLDLSPGVALDFTLPAAVAPAAPAAVDTATETDTSTEVDGSVAPSPAPAPTGPVVPEGFVAVPFSVRVLGPYPNATTFLQALQTGTERLLLVTSTEIIAQDEAEATPTRPAVADGDVEMTVTGYLYVLKAPAATPAPAPAG